MNKSINNLILGWILNWFRIIKRSTLRSLNTKDIFTGIYKNNYWKSLESISGPGSEIKQTTSLINNLNILLHDMKIASVLDIPCGDFKWMQKVDLSNIEYIGADIVEELIKSNIEQYTGKNNLRFKILNLINDPLPKCDIIFIRDCLVHFQYDDIYKAIANIKASGCKYLMTTTFVNYHNNFDIVTGDWRRLNLQEKPFNFPNPILVINENCTEGNGKYKDKSMALWEINKI